MSCDLWHDNGCRWCGKALTGRRTAWCSKKCQREHKANHHYPTARRKVREAAAVYRCAACGFTYPLGQIEVDHIEPADGRHSQWDCIHHINNLQVLCKVCHRDKTNYQRGLK